MELSEVWVVQRRLSDTYNTRPWMGYATLNTLYSAKKVFASAPSMIGDFSYDYRMFRQISIIEVIEEK